MIIEGKNHLTVTSRIEVNEGKDKSISPFIMFYVDLQFQVYMSLFSGFLAPFIAL